MTAVVSIQLAKIIGQLTFICLALGVGVVSITGPTWVSTAVKAYYARLDYEEGKQFRADLMKDKVLAGIVARVKCAAFDDKPL